MPSPDDFGPAYYRSGNYKNYLKRWARYRAIAKDLVDDRHGDDRRGQDRVNAPNCDLVSPLLDFGCGPGLLLRGLEYYGVDATGFDWSPWAVNYARLKGLDATDCWGLVRLAEWQTVVALDVFEHMPLDRVSAVLRALKTYWLGIRIPVASREGSWFHLEVSRRDPTHVTCMTKQGWASFFGNHSFLEVSRIYQRHIWDEKGVYCAWFRRG